MKKRILSALLVALLCLSLFPVAVFAGNDDLQTLINKAEPNAVIKLESNVNLNSALTVPKDKTVTVDLNGYSINRGLSKKSAVKGGSVIVVYGNLTVKDSKGTGLITGGNTTGIAGGVNIAGNAVFTLESGSIFGNKAGQDGGGVYIQKNAKFVMNGGIVSGNSAKNNGGGILACDDFIMTGGELLNNTATGRGGALYIYGNDTSKANGKVTAYADIKNAVISGNSAGVYGGGIYVHYYDMDLKMSNTLITLNTASSIGGGIYSNRSLTNLGAGNSISLNSAGISHTDNMYSPDRVMSNDGEAVDAIFSFLLRVSIKLFGR